MTATAAMRDRAPLRLAALARRGREEAGTEQERCELCGEPIAAEHRHLVDVQSRELMCACRACSLLFDREAAGGGHFRVVGERRLRLGGFQLPDELWAALQIPVEMAFFSYASSAARVLAFYPGPMGATESLLALDAWQSLVAANPVLEGIAPDTEALLVSRARGAREHWLVPISDCYVLAGVIRSHWRGFTGGREVWQQIEHFFAELNMRAPAQRPATATTEAR
jgi:hypothetical protein